MFMRKKYFGDILSADTKNEKNMKEKTTRAIGVIHYKKIASLTEMPYVKHHFKSLKNYKRKYASNFNSQ